MIRPRAGAPVSSGRIGSIVTGRVFLFSLCISAFAAEEGFRPLFNGKNLDGWDGDPRLWKVENGELIGSTDGNPIDRNTFLIYKPKEFGNFILRVEMKIRNHNSGIQFRSEAFPGWVVKGYQADAEYNNWWGGVYDEGGKRGVMVNGWKDKAETVVKRGEWNSYEIYCNGDQIRLTVNGMVTAELHDSGKLKGIIALQLHRAAENDQRGMEARFRKIRIKELP